MTLFCRRPLSNSRRRRWQSLSGPFSLSFTSLFLLACHRYFSFSMKSVFLSVCHLYFVLFYICISVTFLPICHLAIKSISHSFSPVFLLDVPEGALFSGNLVADLYLLLLLPLLTVRIYFFALFLFYLDGFTTECTYQRLYFDLTIPMVNDFTGQISEIYFGQYI